MTMRILLIDDDPDSVAVVRDELTNELDCSCKIVGFETVEDSLNDYDPHVVVLDVLQGTGAEGQPSGLDTSSYIWEKKFCPLVFYTAHAEYLQGEPHEGHPFWRVVKKGSDSEKEVLQRIQQFAPHISALEDAGREIRWTMNDALREIAPRIFEKILGEAELADTLVRSARRRVAAKMDDALSSGGANLTPWEFYLCPPVAKHLLTGDIIRRRLGSREDPTNYAVILTPSCDLANPKVPQVLVSRCKGPDRLLQDLGLKDVQKWKDDHTKRLLNVLRQGYAQSCMPLPALPGEFPPMAADFRDLQLVDRAQIGDGGEEYARIASLDDPLRELVAWAYMLAAARPGLPERDFKAWAKEIIPATAGEE
jgi:hypothetical protein